jgi:hypothetical protein
MPPEATAAPAHAESLAVLEGRKNDQFACPANGCRAAQAGETSALSAEEKTDLLALERA